MGAVIVVLGGVAGFAFAFAAYLSGLDVVWIIASYIIGGYGSIALLFFRHFGLSGASSNGMNRRLDREMIALREWQDRESCREETEGQASLFAILRDRS